MRRETVKLSFVIGTSLVTSAVIAGAAWHYVARDAALAGFWLRDPVASAWIAVGGPGGLGLLGYALVSCVLVTAGIMHDLSRVRRRLGAETAVDPQRLPEQWHAALAGTDFADLAGHITRDELGIAPIALVRILRAEIWRIYVKRLLLTQTMTIVLAAVAIAVGPYVKFPWPVAPGSAPRLAVIGAMAVLAGIPTVWLMVDRGINSLAATMTELSASWQAVLALPPRGAQGLPRRRGPETLASPGIDALVAAVNNLVTILSAQAAASAPTPPADAYQQALNDLAERQNALVEAFARVVSAQMEEMVGNRWNELVAALHAMSVGLVRFAETGTRRGAETRLLDAPTERGTSLGEELQKLLDELAEHTYSGTRPKAKSEPT
jgi:hypothetical protein